MANIMDYLDWRGDVPLLLSPMNDVDSFILCKICTIDWTGIVPEDGNHIPLHQAVKTYLERGGAKRLGVVASPYTVPMVERLPETDRFGTLELTGYRKIGNENEQFSALTVRLPDGRHYIGYRGTDDTLAAWREDCMLAIETVPAQTDALEYLEWAAEQYPGRLIVGGHSKGGNLALYAAANASEAVQERIGTVYNFDGPGFENDFFTTEGYRRMAPRCRSITSQHAAIGTLLHQQTGFTVVRSTAFGIAAHDGFTWETTPTGFMLCEDFAPAAKAFNETMDTVLDGMTRKERMEFVDAFFGVLSSTGAVTLTELSETGLRQALATVRALNARPEVKNLLLQVMENMVRCYVAEKAAARPRPSIRFRRPKKEKKDI